MALCSFTGRERASLVPVKARQLTPGSQAKVFLAGVSKEAPEQSIKLAVRNAVEAATDFSWLSKGDAVFIKPVNNSGNPYPATTSPTAIAAMVEILKEKGAERDGFIDKSKVVPMVANHMVTSWLGGWGPALASETLTKNSLNTIWDDRVLIHSYEIFGGVPAILLESANSALPEALKNRLGRMTALPA